MSYEDVTDKVRLEAERADQEEVLKAFVYEGPQYCFVEDEEFKIRLISEGAAELIAGKPSADLIGKDALEHFSLEDQKRIVAARSERDEHLERGETVVSNTPMTFKRGEDTVKVRVQVKLLHLPSGAVMRGIIFDDITSNLMRQREIEQQKLALQIQAKTDPLTGLWNRLGLNEQLQTAEGAERDQELAVYLLDVDFFKSVNDIYSHQVGDDLLIAVGNTLKEVTQRPL